MCPEVVPGGPRRGPDEVLELWEAEIEGENRAKQGGMADSPAGRPGEPLFEGRRQGLFPTTYQAPIPTYPGTYPQSPPIPTYPHRVCELWEGED